MRARTLIVSGLAAVVAVLGGGGSASAGGGCMHGTDPSSGGGTVVELVGACFTPTVLYVDPGTEVTFENRDPKDHMVMGVGGTWGSFDELGKGDSVAYTFAEDGVYVYSCFIHPGMVGAIVAGSGTGTAGMDTTSVSGGLVTGPDVAPPATPASATDGNALGALLVGGTAGLVIGGGLAAAALRRRRETVGVDRAVG
jgi:plastocyanin